MKVYRYDMKDKTFSAYIPSSTYVTSTKLTSTSSETNYAYILGSTNL